MGQHHPPECCRGCHRLVAGAAVAGTHRRDVLPQAERTAAELGGLDPDQIEELDDTALTRAERKQIRDHDRHTWRTPALDTLPRPAISPLRAAGMIALRGYLPIAVALVGVKIFQQITA